MKHKLLITGLATATLLSTAALTQYSTSVFAEGEQPTYTASVTPLKESEKKEALKNALESLEKEAIAEIEKNKDIVDKEAAKKEALEAIGKDSLLAAIENGEISVDDAIENLPTAEDEVDKPATPAPGAELVRNEAGEVTEVKPINGGIDADAQDKINKRLDEEKTDLKDATERKTAAEEDFKNAEKIVKELEKVVADKKAVQDKVKKELASYADADGEQADQYRAAAQKDLDETTKNLKQAEEALEAAKKDVESYKKDLEIETKRFEAIEDVLIESLQNKVADLEQEISKLEEQLKDAENGEVEDFVKEGLEKAIAEKKAELEKAEEELNAVLYGVEPAVNEVPEYKGPELNRPAKPEPEKYPTPTPNPEPTPGTPAPTPGTPAPTPGTPAPAPAQTPAATPAQTPAATPAAEVPATPAEATSEEAAPVAVAAQAEESKKEELPNTGTAELGLITPAVLSFLAGLGLTFGKKEDK